MGFTVRSSGLMTTVQDGGRPGYAKYGVTASGPMDRRSFELANLLAGNRQGEACLEFTLLGPELLLDSDCVLAVTGGDFSPALNGVPIEMYCSVPAKAGDLLTFGAARSGCRGYAAFSGGIETVPVMGSRSTNLENRIGGLDGRALKPGDRLGFGPPGWDFRPAFFRRIPREHFGGTVVLRVIPGPQEDRFTEEGLHTFYHTAYQVTGNSNRMGCRLLGEAIQHRTDGNIISDGIVCGAVQVPSNGQPIILLAEHATVGGYTKIAAVISADLSKAGQCAPGDWVRFEQVSLSQAHALYGAQQRELARIREELQTPPTSGAPRYFDVSVGASHFSVELREYES